MSTGAQSWVVALYDAYVTTTADIPFFLTEVGATSGPVLELMAGTGRLSLPLAEAGASLTCVDISGPMLERLRGKLAARKLKADVAEMDVVHLDLPHRDFALALLPFQSFAEILSVIDQQSVLQTIAAHLRPRGRLICTLHNPVIRRRTVDGQLRLLGRFSLDDRDATLLLWSHQQFAGDGAEVRAAQLYEIYDAEGRLEEKRWLDVRFRLIAPDEFRVMAGRAGFRIAALYGNYDRSAFDERSSPFMIWILGR